MTVHVLETEYQRAAEKAHIRNWLNQTVALRLDKVNTGDDGTTTSIAVTVLTADDTETGSPARVESARMIGQIAATGAVVGDVLIVHVVPYGKRGQVFAPPANGDKAAKTLADALAG